MTKENPNLVATLEAIRTGKQGYYNGGVVGNMLKTNADKSISFKKDADKEKMPNYGIDKFLASFGFKLDKNSKVLDMKNKYWFYKAYSDKYPDRSLGISYNGKTGNFVIDQSMKKQFKDLISDNAYKEGNKNFKDDNNIFDSKFKGNAKANSNSTLTKKQSDDFMSASAYVEGAEKFGGSNDIFDANVQNDKIYSNSVNLTDKNTAIKYTAQQSTTKTTTKQPTTEIKQSTTPIVAENKTTVQETSKATEEIVQNNFTLVELLQKVLDTNESVRLTTTKEKKEFEDLNEAKLIGYQMDMLREQHIQTMIDKETDYAKLVVDTEINRRKEIEATLDNADYINRLFYTDEQKQNYALSKKQQEINIMNAEIRQILTQADKYKYIGKVLTNKDLSKVDLSMNIPTGKEALFGKFNYDTSMSDFDNKVIIDNQIALNLQKQAGLKISEATTKQEQLTNEQLDTRVSKYSAMAQSYVGLFDSFLTGSMSYDRGAGVSAITSMVTKAITNKKEGTNVKFTTNEKIQGVGYTLDTLNNFLQAEVQSKIKSNEYEQQILATRIKGARTEEEKLALEQEQLELQKQAIDLQYQASTSYMGTSGTTGSALSGLVSGATAGATVGGPWGAVIGAGLGLAGGILGGSSAKKDAERQKELLEYQYKMTKYLEEMNENISANNTLLSTVATQGNKIGVYNATQSALSAVANSVSDTIGGSATAAWNDRSWHGGIKSGWSDNWITTMANYDLEDLGFSEADLKDANKLQSILTAINTEQAKYAQYATTYNVTEGIESQAHANYLALEEFKEQIQAIIDLYAELSPKIYASYMGATLEAIKDSAGVITDYYIDWTDYLSTQFSNIYSNLTSNIVASASSLTSTFFSGLNNMFIQNYSGMSGILNSMTSLYETFATAMSKDRSTMDMTTVNATIKELITLTKDYKDEQEVVTATADKFIQLWIDNGGDVSDVIDSMSAGMKSVYESMEEALGKDDYADLLSGLASSIGTNFTDALKTSMLNKSSMTSIMSELYAQMNSSVNELTIESSQQLYNSIAKASVQLASENAKLQALSSIFDTSSIDYYSNTGDQIQYTTGTTQSSVTNISLTTKVEPNYLFTSSSEEVMDLANLLSNSLVTVLKEKNIL